MKREPLFTDYLRDILEHAEKVQSFIAGLDEDAFHQDEKTIFAVIRALEVVGEAAKKIPQPIRDKYPDIPWREMAGMRDKLIHDYFGVNTAVIWKTAVEDIPALIPLIHQVFKNETD
jgi:uncharacterized protein with HEPN domain